jgi:hypothetical protein
MIVALRPGLPADHVIRRLMLVSVLVIAAVAVHPAAGSAACANPVACENAKPGSAPSA